MSRNLVMLVWWKPSSLDCRPHIWIPLYPRELSCETDTVDYKHVRLVVRCCLFEFASHQWMFVLYTACHRHEKYRTPFSIRVSKLDTLSSWFANNDEARPAGLQSGSFVRWKDWWLPSFFINIAGQMEVVLMIEDILDLHWYEWYFVTSKSLLHRLVLIVTTAGLLSFQMSFVRPIRSKQLSRSSSIGAIYSNLLSPEKSTRTKWYSSTSSIKCNTIVKQTWMANCLRSQKYTSDSDIDDNTIETRCNHSCETTSTKAMIFC